MLTIILVSTVILTAFALSLMFLLNVQRGGAVASAIQSLSAAFPDIHWAGEHFRDLRGEFPGLSLRLQCHMGVVMRWNITVTLGDEVFTHTVKNLECVGALEEAIGSLGLKDRILEIVSDFDNIKDLSSTYEWLSHYYPEYLWAMKGETIVSGTSPTIVIKECFSNQYMLRVRVEGFNGFEYIENARGFHDFFRNLFWGHPLIYWMCSGDGDISMTAVPGGVLVSTKTGTVYLSKAELKEDGAPYVTVPQ